MNNRNIFICNCYVGKLFNSCTIMKVNAKYNYNNNNFCGRPDCRSIATLRPPMQIRSRNQGSCEFARTAGNGDPMRDTSHFNSLKHYLK